MAAANSVSPRQLALDFPVRPALTGDDFLVAPSNEEAIRWLDAWPDWPAPWVSVHGPGGAGKTHLVQVFLARTGGRALTPGSLDDAARALIGGGAVQTFALDGVERFLAEDGETALFHLYNVCRETGGHVLATASDAPSVWPFALADLKSRILAAPSAGIRMPDDQLLGALLAKHFTDRQVALRADVLAYLLPRMERSFSAVRDLAILIDGEALALKKPVTVRLVSRLLARLQGTGQP